MNTQRTADKTVNLALVIAASRVLAALKPLHSAGTGANLLPALAALDLVQLSDDLAVLLGVPASTIQQRPLHLLIQDLAAFARDLPAYVAAIGQVAPALEELTSALKDVAGTLPDLQA